MKFIHMIEIEIFILVFISPNPVAKSQKSDPDTLTHWQELEEMRDLKIDLDFKHTDLKDIIRLIANQYGLNIFIEDYVSKFTTLHLVNISVKKALNFICKENNLSIQRSGLIYKISNNRSNDFSSASEQGINIIFIDGLLSADFKNQDVRKVFHGISQLRGKNIFLDENVNGLTSEYFHNLNVDKELYYLAPNNGYYIIQDNVIYQLPISYLSNSEQSLHSTDCFLQVYDNLIDLKIVNGQLVTILNEIFRQLGMNLFLFGDLKVTVSAMSSNLTLDECLNFILCPNDYIFKKMGNL